MSDPLDNFRLDELYSNEQIFQSLQVSNAGGVRYCLGPGPAVKRMVIMTSAAVARIGQENPYHDRVEGDTLVYTGKGREGDQTISGANSRIPAKAEALFPIYCFMIIRGRKKKSSSNARWRFLGMLEFLRCHKEMQVDVRGAARWVWLFEFRIHRKMATIWIENDAEIMSLLDLGRGSRELGREDEQVVVDRHLDGVGAKEGPTLEQKEAIRRRLLELSPQGFEELVRDVIALSGFERVEVTRFTQDGGIDVNAFAGPRIWPLGQSLVQVQAKRWLHTVGRREVAELRGSLQPHAHGALVTTSHFSRAALNEARADGKRPITLVDGHELAGIVARLEVVVAPQGP